MQRWPDVPAVYGWLRLDRRGRWLLIDRARPGFDEARDGAGSPITNPQILEFIARNYQSEPDGCWYWQNGPQRVFVDLEIAPLILRVLGTGAQAALVTHTGVLVGRVDAAWLTPQGDLLLVTDAGPAAVHDLDLGLLDFGDEDADGCPRELQILGNRVAIKPAGLASPGFKRRPRPAA
jgi:hypothetical protein